MSLSRLVDRKRVHSLALSWRNLSWHSLLMIRNLLCWKSPIRSLYHSFSIFRLHFVVACVIIKVRAVYYIIIVLRSILLQPIMLSKESKKLFRRSIIGKLMGLDTFSCKHFLKKHLSMASSLDAFMDIEI